MAVKRYTLFLYGALMVAFVATYLVYRTLESAKAGTQIATTKVVLATRDIAEGELIDRVAVATADWPTSTVPAGAYAVVDSVAGRVARVNVFKGEAFVPGRLAPEGTTAGLVTKILPGRRAMGIRINDVSGIAGMIQPNARVDILLTMNPTGEGGRVAKLFMSNMRVLAIGTQSQPGEDGRPINSTVATLDVSPEEAEKLAVAQAQGSIQLVMRGYGDPDTVNTRGASSNDVANSLREYTGPPKSVRNQRPARQQRPSETASQPAAPAPTPTPPVIQAPPPKVEKPESLTVQVYRGSVRKDEKFKKDSVKPDTVKR